MSRDVTKRDHPTALRPYLPEIQEFAKKNHYGVLHPILRFRFVYNRRLEKLKALGKVARSWP